MDVKTDLAKVEWLAAKMYLKFFNEAALVDDPQDEWIVKIRNECWRHADAFFKATNKKAFEYGITKS